MAEGNVYMNIKKQLQAYSKQMPVLYGEVKSISGNSCTIQVDDLQLSAKLTSIEEGGNKDMIIAPAVGSTVVCLDLSGGNFDDVVVVKYSEVQTITVNGGNNGGLVNIETLKTYLNTLQQAISTGLNGVGAGTAASGAAGAAAFAQAMTATLDNIEDNKIKH